MGKNEYIENWKRATPFMVSALPLYAGSVHPQLTASRSIV
jgi:hypothetical protein